MPSTNRFFSHSPSQGSSQIFSQSSSYRTQIIRTQTIQVVPKKASISFLTLINLSVDWKKWNTDLNEHITMIHQTKQDSKSFEKLLIRIGKLLNTHMRQTRTCRGAFAREMRNKIQSLITTLEANPLVEAEKKAFAKKPEKIPLSIKLIRLAEKVMPLTHQTCTWDKIPSAIKIIILAQGLFHENRKEASIALQVIRNEMNVNPTLGNSLLIQYIRESNCSNLEWLAFTPWELAILVKEMDRTGLRDRISFRGLKENSITWRFYQEYMKSNPEAARSLLMSAINSDDRQPSLALLSKERKDYLIHILNSTKPTKHANKRTVDMNNSDARATPHILNFLREVVSYDSKQGFALWARIMANPYVIWDDHLRTRLTQAEIEGIVENMSFIPQVNWPRFIFGALTWKEIFRTAFNKGLNGHLESWQQIARLINYQILESSPKQKEFDWAPLEWTESLIPWSATGLPLENLPFEFRALITHLNLHLNDDNCADLASIVGTFPHLTALSIVADSPIPFILPKICKNLEILILEKVNVTLEDMPNLRILRLKHCDSIISSANPYEHLETFRTQRVKYRMQRGPLLIPIIKTINLNNCENVSSLALSA